MSSAMDTAKARALDGLASMDAEHAIIGGLLLDNDAFDRVADVLGPEHFFGTENAEIYAEISRQLVAGHPADAVSVAEGLRGKVTLAELAALAQFVPSAANIKRYAAVVVERAKSRALIGVSGAVAELAGDHSRSIEDRIDEAQGQLAKLLDDAPSDDWQAMGAGLLNHVQVLEDRAAGRVKSIPTGLSDLDRMLSGGLRPGNLVVIGARPSMGKTALALTAAVNIAVNYSVGVFSMEMTCSELFDRATAMLGRVSLSTVLQPAKPGNELDWDKVLQGVEEARLLNLHLSDKAGLNINQLRSRARKLRRVHGVDVLVVDYLGLMEGLDKKQQRAYQLEEICRGLKALAKDLGIAVLLLAQVNRKVEERADQTPGLSDLRDSGAIEQDADVVMFIHRPIQAKKDLGDEWRYYARLAIEKNRQGPTGYCHLSYISEQTRFANWHGEAPVRPSAFASKRNGPDL